MTQDETLNFDLSRIRVDAAIRVCPECLGTGVVVMEEDGVPRARPCACREEAARGRRHAAAGIPRRYRGCSLDNFDLAPNLEPAGAMRALTVAKRFAFEYPNVDAGLIFMGPVGVGKTHLATGIVHQLLARGVGCRWCDFGELLADIRRRFDGGGFGEYQLLEPLVAAEVLLLDDIGAMKIRDWTLDLLSYVINQRYVNGRIIIATTNYLDAGRGADGDGPTLVGHPPWGESEPALGGARRADETLAERIGDRLRSRLLEMCKTVRLDGRDFRERKQPTLLRILD